MLKLVALVAVIFALGCSSCAHVPPPIVDFGQCLNKDISTQVNAIITEVETDLASAQYVQLLTDLGKKLGWTIVDCAVQEVLGSENAKLQSAPNDQLGQTKVVHAKAWLSRS